jgi:hypothetical protein
MFSAFQCRILKIVQNEGGIVKGLYTSCQTFRRGTIQTQSVGGIQTQGSPHLFAGHLKMMFKGMPDRIVCIARRNLAEMAAY